MRNHFALSLLAAAALAAGCGDPPPTTVGDAVKGKALFNSASLKLGGCFTCHSISSGVIVSGPSLFNYGATAEAKFASKSKASAHEYIKWQIVSPDEEVTDGFSKGVMPTGYGTALSATDINDIAAYLLTLK